MSLISIRHIRGCTVVSVRDEGGHGRVVVKGTLLTAGEVFAITRAGEPHYLAFTDSDGTKSRAYCG